MSKKSFEDNMLRLEEIVRTIEQGDASLEESLKLFQEGTKLVQKCQETLDYAQLQVTKITADADGSPVEEGFDAEFS